MAVCNMDSLAICTYSLSKRFGEEYAVSDLNFSVPRGTIFGFIGPSGSGKTTTIRMLTGVYPPTEGEIMVLDVSPNKFRQRLRARLGYMPQHFALYEDMTVWENMNFAASIYGMSYRRGDRLREALDFVELLPHRHKRVRQISGGMRRRLSLAATLVHDPDLIFLDEPTAGIDPVLRQKFWKHFRSLQKDGRTLFVTTQYVSEAAYCDEVGVLVGGRLLTVDSPEGLRRRALGGDVVALETEREFGLELHESLYELGFVKRVERSAPTQLRIVVTEADTAIPVLLRWLEQQEVNIASVQEYQPAFDDVFVALIEQAQ